MIHKQILDAAASDPAASMGDIADAVTGANTGLVERVLEEYGDPGQPVEEGSMDGVDSDSDSDSGFDSDSGLDHDFHSESEPDPDTDVALERNTDLPDPETLTEAQLETLYAIADRPTATQSELATQFDITSASISQRLSGIDGFDWADRTAFIEALFDADTVDREADSLAAVDASGDNSVVGDTARAEPDGGPKTPVAAPPDGTNSHLDPEIDVDVEAESATQRRPNTDDSPSDTDTQHCSCHGQLETITARIDHLDRRLRTHAESDPDPDPEPELEPELVHKVAHACVTADHISTDEELQILRTLMNPNGN